jgi:hypothetical protein
MSEKQKRDLLLNEVRESSEDIAKKALASFLCKFCWSTFVASFIAAETGRILLSG